MTGRRAAPGMPKEPCPLFMIAGRRATYQLPGVLVRASPLLLDNPTPDLVGLAYTWQDGGRLQLLLCILLLLPLTSFCTPRAERWPCFVITLIYDKTHVCIPGHLCATYTSQECFRYLQSPSFFFVWSSQGISSHWTRKIEMARNKEDTLSWTIPVCLLYYYYYISSANTTLPSPTSGLFE